MSGEIDDQVYEVFAARSHKAGLEHIGSIRADGPDIAALHGHAIYDEENWIDMKVVPRDCLHDVSEYTGDH